MKWVTAYERHWWVGAGGRDFGARASRIEPQSPCHAPCRNLPAGPTLHPSSRVIRRQHLCAVPAALPVPACLSVPRCLACPRCLTCQGVHERRTEQAIDPISYGLPQVKIDQATIDNAESTETQRQIAEHMKSKMLSAKLLRRDAIFERRGASTDHLTPQLLTPLSRSCGRRFS